MSFSRKIIIWFTILISNVYSIGIDKNISNIPQVNILNDFNYTYNIADIKIAKTSQNSWQRSKEYGYFTAIAYRDGFDHGYEVVRVLITKVNESKDGTADMVVMKDIQIDTPGIAGYITDMRLDVVNNKLSLGLDIRTRIEPNLIVKQNLMIDLDGNVSNLIPFKIPMKVYEAFDK